jgi:uncharacterized protein (DUF2141 family)
MDGRSVALCSALVFANLPAIAFGQCPGIHIEILNIRNSTGTVACALFESPAGFPTEFLSSATNVMVIKVRKTRARCTFEDIPPGTYAIGVIHTVFRMTPEHCWARLHSRRQASRMTGECWI